MLLYAYVINCIIKALEKYLLNCTIKNLRNKFSGLQYKNPACGLLNITDIILVNT